MIGLIAPFFMSFAFSCALLLLFPFIPYAIVRFGMHHILSKHVRAHIKKRKSFAFMHRNMCMYKWASIGTCKCTYMLGKIRDGRYEFISLGAQYLLCIFFWGTMSCIYYFWGTLLRTHFLWGIYFENYGLNLGLTLFRPGTRMGPEI